MYIPRILSLSWADFKFTVLGLWAVLLCGISLPTTAQQFDQNYLKWKAQQEAQDQRLTAKQTTAATSQYYLARPKQKVSSSVQQVRLNSASLEQLQQLSGIGLKKAEAIVEYRKQKGQFQSIEELQQVKGIGPALFAKNKHKLAL
ncbi:ComEA family DNA-binding protein [Acinetobacter sp. A2]|uniref:ComEA family DNA-binding protein n=1 Tax=Acinetobacter sp. A2 TaxID=362457 RepID=UPI0014468187|nr:ComEA family DNA-binding protein [Acinetobacter sp. A2]